jgi:hypothetical protein
MPGRDNGFVARHYLPLADLDPRLAEAMLEVLRGESIAAYVEPSTGRLGGYLEVHLPDRPHDRLWVDREHRDRAAALLSQHTEAAPLPALPADEAATDPPAAGDTAVGDDAASSSFEDAWAELVANFDAPGPVSGEAGVPPWPVAEDVLDAPADFIDGQQSLPLDLPDDNPVVPRRIVRPAEPTTGAPTPDAADSPGADYSGEYDPLSILDEHFVPPTPPKPPKMKPATRWAILAIVFGFAVIIVKELSDAVPGGIALGVLAIVGGFAALVAGMRSERGSDDSDDGAVV